MRTHRCLMPFVALILGSACNNGPTPATPTTPISTPAPKTPTIPASTLNRIDEDDQRVADVVFVHGLNGDWRSTWQRNDEPDSFWPAWLAKDLPHIGVWSIHYEAAPSAWLGKTMPLEDRATNVLARLEAEKIGKDRPVVFISHSLGGLVVKKVLQQAQTHQNPAWKPIGENTRGVVFLATPHQGADAAKIAQYLETLAKVFKLSASIDDLKSNAPALRELNVWYRNNVVAPQVEHKVYFEKYGIDDLPLLVDEGSADFGAQGVFPIPMDADHISICKPESRDALVYKQIRAFLEQKLQAANATPPLPKPIDIILPAKDKEALVIVFAPHNAAKASLANTIASYLRSELSNGITTAQAISFDRWRIEPFQYPLNKADATKAGETLKALFVITGQADEGTVTLDIDITTPVLLINSAEMEHLGLRLDQRITQVVMESSELSTKVVVTAQFLRAMQFYFNGDFKNCESYLTTILTQSPPQNLSARIHYLRGTCRFFQRKYAEAVVEFDESERLGLTADALYWRRAEAHLAQLDVDAAEADIKAALQRTDFSAVGYYVAGLATYQVLDILTEQFRVAFKEQPDLFDKADDFLRVSSEKDPSLVRAWLARVRLYRKYGRYMGKDVFKTMKEFLAEAALANQKSDEIQMAIAANYAHGGDFEGALRHLKKAGEFGAPAAAVHFAAANICEAKKSPEDALTHWTAYLDSRDDEAGWWLRRAEARALIRARQTGAQPNLFYELESQEAEERRKSLIAYVKAWIGKTWTKDFHGGKSYRDFVLFALTEQGLLPRKADRQSATELFERFLLHADVVAAGDSSSGDAEPRPGFKNDQSRTNSKHEIEKLRLPVWVAGMGTPLLIISAERGENDGEWQYTGVRLEYADNAEPKVVQVTEKKGSAFDFFQFERQSIRTNLKLAVDGDY